MDNLAALEDLDAYCRLFTSVELWRPYVQAVCRRHNLNPHRQVRVGIPGTYPAFLVEDRWVVKFFGRLFDGGRAFEVEREAARLVQQSRVEIPTARVVAAGRLGGGGWPWPYLIFDFIPGVSIGAVMDQLTPRERLRLARALGHWVRRLHDIPLDGQATFPNCWEPYLAFLQEQRDSCVQNHRGWGTLPAHLIHQIEAFLPPVEALVDRARPPHLIHADLTRDHLLGRLEEGHWTSLALIDFGDAMTGSLWYELAALHLDLFGGDSALLAEFWAGYAPVPRPKEGARLALAAALLHRFNVLASLPPEKFQVDTLEELARSWWEPGKTTADKE